MSFPSPSMSKRLLGRGHSEETLYKYGIQQIIGGVHDGSEQASTQHAARPGPSPVLAALYGSSLTYCCCT
eukprot:5294804-Amphidinium_carterae.2